MLDEAIALRAAGITAPTLSWLWTPGEGDSLRRALAADIDVSVSSRWQLDAVVAVAEESGHQARVHLKIDTGLSRNGATVADWPDLVAACAKTKARCDRGVGVWSHFAYADEPGHPTIARQVERFTDAVAVAEAARALNLEGASTSPTPRRRSRCHRRTSTWCGQASRSTASTRCRSTVTSV